MDFKNDLRTLYPPSEYKGGGEFIKLPINIDFYFRSKQREILDQYFAARRFLAETECSHWEHWFVPIENKRADEGAQCLFRSYFYESSLFFYNALVDLTWTLTYVCTEFALTYKGERVDFSGMVSLEDAANMLREAEKSVTAPTAETNPFGYLKKMCPEYTTVIDHIVGFWNGFADGSIRRKYNYCKHKGKPAYTEITNKQGPKLVGSFILQQSNLVELPSDTRDVRWAVSLNDCISELLEYDDNQFFPYLKSLFEELERIIEPSPMVL